jgi:hypothetical protein
MASWGVRAAVLWRQSSFRIGLVEDVKTSAQEQESVARKMWFPHGSVRVLPLRGFAATQSRECAAPVWILPE